VAGNAGSVGVSVWIFFRTTSCRVEKPVSDIRRASPEIRVGSGV